MRKVVVIVVILAAVGAAWFAMYGRGNASGAGPEQQPGGGGAGGRSGAGGRPPMPVEFATVKRAALAEHVLIVGNLIGAATVEAVPRINGRLLTVNVRLGDPVRRGQLLAKIEDREIQEQVRQAAASHEVAKATIRQREADLKLAQTNLERNKNLLDRELLPRQTFDDTDARHQAAVAQVDLAKAQFEQAKARLEELKINLSNTNILSPVDGFVGKRHLDPGASVGPNAPVASVVDIRSVRLVANLVEKDTKRVVAGTPAQVEVDAFPGEKFAGKVSRVAPVFDPATRTAEMEIEVANPGFRLKPGMYARVELTVDTKADALTVPRNALVNLEGKQGVFVAVTGSGRQGGGGRGAGAESRPQSATPPATPATGPTPSAEGPPPLTAKFIAVETGIRDADRIEITTGLSDGARVITTGAGALKDGDRIVAAQGERSGRGRATDATTPPGRGNQGSTR